MDDLKKYVDKVVSKVKKDKNFAKKFKTEPIKAVEEVIGIDLPDEVIEKIITVAKTKIKLDKSDVADALKGLLKK